MARSPDSLFPSTTGQLGAEKREDKAPECREGGEANPRAATKVNAVSASSTPPAIIPTQLELFPGRACPLKAKPATTRREASTAGCRGGVQGGGTRRKSIEITGETLFGPRSSASEPGAGGREAYKGRQARNRRIEAGQGVGGGHSTGEPREYRGEGRAATSTKRAKRGKATGLPPRGKARTRSRTPRDPRRMSTARKLQRTLYRVAKSQPERRFTRLYDKICQRHILEEAWQRVKRNGGSAGVDRESIEAVKEAGEERFLAEIQAQLAAGDYRASCIRRVNIPKPGQPGRTRPLGIPTVRDRVVQMAVKIVIEPLFEADFMPCSFGFRPKRTARQALSTIAGAIRGGFKHIVDVDLRSYFDTIDHQRLMALVERRVGDIQILRMIRAWLRAGVMEEGRVDVSYRGTPQGGVISPLLANIFLHEIDRLWCDSQGGGGTAVLVRYADDMVLMARTEAGARLAWARLQRQVAALDLEVNQEKSMVTTVEGGFAFLGFEFRERRDRLYMFPRKKAVKTVLERARQTVRSFASDSKLSEVIKMLNRVLIGWCTYFRVGNSNRVFHTVDWGVRSELQLWLRRKHRCSWASARKRWNFKILHDRCRLYRMVGKVSHLEGLR